MFSVLEGKPSSFIQIQEGFQTGISESFFAQVCSGSALLLVPYDEMPMFVFTDVNLGMFFSVTLHK